MLNQTMHKTGTKRVHRYFFQNPVLDVPSPTYLLHFLYQSEAPCEGAVLKETTETIKEEPEALATVEALSSDDDGTGKQKQQVARASTPKTDRSARKMCRAQRTK